MRRLAVFSLFLLGFGMIATHPAHSDELTLARDETTLVPLAEAPTTVVVSNPNVADVTVRGNTLLFLGKTNGSTNVILLDEEGGEVRNWRVHVIEGDPYGVVLFKAGKRENFTCKGECEPVGPMVSTPPQ